MGTKKIFEGLGKGSLIPQRGRQPLHEEEPQFGPEEGFVLSRVDGRTSLEEICMLVPFEEAVTMVILRRLWELGAIDVPGVPRVLKRNSSASHQVIKPSSPSLLPAKPAPAPAPEKADDQGLPPAVRTRVDAYFTRLDQMSPYELLELDRSADSKAVKRAYFKLSKEFHPDRYFGKELGDYGDKLSRVFQAVKSAFELLSDDNRRRAYEESVGHK